MHGSTIMLCYIACNCQKNPQHTKGKINDKCDEFITMVAIGELLYIINWSAGIM